MQRREEVDLLRAFAGEICAGVDFTIAGQNERGIDDAGFQNKDPLRAHGMECAQTVKGAEIKKRILVAGNPCAGSALTLSLRDSVFHTHTILNYHV